MSGIKGKTGVYEHKPLSEATKKKIGKSNSIALKGRKSDKKGKTFIEMYGEERAKKLCKEHSDKIKLFLINNPEKHPNRIMSKRNAKGFISKPQYELYLLIKQKYQEAELEYPIKTNYSIRFADIAIPSLKLDIEYDGQSWHINKQLDDLRDKHLIEVGWKTIRFNKDNIKKVNKIVELK